MHDKDHLGVEFRIRRTTAFKVGRVFRQELLDIIAQEGKIDSAEFWKLILVVSRMLPSDTQEIEGINGMIKHILRLYPSIGQSLLNARTLCRKSLADALGSLATLKAGPQLTDAVDKLVTQCLPGHIESKHAIFDRDRFFDVSDKDMNAALTDGPLILTLNWIYTRGLSILLFWVITVWQARF